MRAARRLYQAFRMSPSGGKRRRASSGVTGSTSSGHRSRASAMLSVKRSSSHSRNPTRRSPVTAYPVLRRPPASTTGTSER